MDQLLSNSAESIEIDAIDVEIDVPILSGINNANESSWGARHKRIRRERNAVAEAFEFIERPQWSRYFVSLVRNGPRKLDDDNVVGAFKAVRDQLSQWLGIDDGDERIVWQYAQRICQVKNNQNKLKSWARVRITPVPHDFAQDESAARIKAPRREPVELDDKSQPRFVQKPRAIPELAGGKPERVIELQPRNNSVSSRMRVRLMRNTRDTGVGKGVLYAHLSLFWTDRRSQAWRSQGISIRLEEIWDVVAALKELALGVGVVERGRGVISLGGEGGGGSDTPSNNVNHNVGKGVQLPHSLQNPLQKPPPRSMPGKWEIPSEYFPTPENLEIALNKCDHGFPADEECFSCELRRQAGAIEDSLMSAPAPEPDYTSPDRRDRAKEEIKRKRGRPKGSKNKPKAMSEVAPVLDVNALAEDADNGQDE